MAFNALDNAVKYNLRSGGTIECATFVDGDNACIRVTNSGPIVEADQVPRLFERFERGETRTERDGHGLGLPILRRVAEAHGGAATASARPGGGLIVTVAVPRSPQAVRRKEL
jgi:signal transduction histidine kinase